MSKTRFEIDRMVYEPYPEVRKAKQAQWKREAEERAKKKPAKKEA